MRRMGLDRNPMRRFSDRVESAVLVLVVICMLGAVPLALLAGTVTHDRLRAAASELRSTTAVLEQDAPVPVVSSELVTTTSQARALGTWITADGSPRSGEVFTRSGATAGSSVVVWLDPEGTPVRPPLDASELVLMAVLVTLGVLAAAEAAAGLFYVTVRAVLDRGRLASWEDEWERVAGDWTRRR
ncbi:Rv1733c family protein [Allokutzneria oryzae]|uniref:Transmembrane protein n=1 Tax=Allokutzneria oryzae TaxID=1378989 RepID=A0ABV6A3B5_9PSEU